MRIAIQKKAKIATIISTNHLASAAVFVIPLYPITKQLQIIQPQVLFHRQVKYNDQVLVL